MAARAAALLALLLLAWPAGAARTWTPHDQRPREAGEETAAENGDYGSSGEGSEDRHLAHDEPKAGLGPVENDAAISPVEDDAATSDSDGSSEEEEPADGAEDVEEDRDIPAEVPGGHADMTPPTEPDEEELDDSASSSPTSTMVADSDDLEVGHDESKGKLGASPFSGPGFVVDVDVDTGDIKERDFQQEGHDSADVPLKFESAMEDWREDWRANLRLPDLDDAGSDADVEDDLSDESPPRASAGPVSMSGLEDFFDELQATWAEDGGEDFRESFGDVFEEYRFQNPELEEEFDIFKEDEDEDQGELRSHRGFTRQDAFDDGHAQPGQEGAEPHFGEEGNDLDVDQAWDGLRAPFSWADMDSDEDHEDADEEGWQVLQYSTEGEGDWDSMPPNARFDLEMARLKDSLKHGRSVMPHLALIEETIAALARSSGSEMTVGLMCGDLLDLRSDFLNRHSKGSAAVYRSWMAVCSRKLSVRRYPRRPLPFDPDLPPVSESDPLLASDIPWPF